MAAQREQRGVLPPKLIYTTRPPVTASRLPLWQPDSFNQANWTAISESFTTGSNIVSLRVGLTINTANGWLGFDDLAIEAYHPSETTWRTSYAFAGQTIALRVIDSDGNDDLYFTHSDHLGSASIMSHSNGSVVADSLARHLPLRLRSGQALRWLARGA